MTFTTPEPRPSALGSQTGSSLSGLDGGSGGGSGGVVGGGDSVPVAGHAASRRLDLNTSALLFVTFSAAPFWELLSNWVLSIQALPGPPQFLVGALDAQTAAECEAQGWRHVTLLPAGGAARVPSRDAARRRQQAEAEDRSSAAARAGLVLGLLEEDGMEAVVVSHPDTAWLRDPAEYLAQHPAADLLISTGCLSHEVGGAVQAAVQAAVRVVLEEAGAPGQPLSGQGRAFNTGVYAVRKTAAARELLASWRDALGDPEAAAAAAAVQPPPPFNETAPRDAGQRALRLLLEEGQDSLPSAPGDPRTVLMRGGSLAVHPLPVLLFPGGHVAFVQRLPEGKGVQPYVVHANGDRWYGADGAQPEATAAAKRGRLREFGLWRVDGADHYAAPRARYLTYSNDVQAFIEELAARRHGGAMPPFYRHLAAMGYQQAQFMDALAAARMLRRTLVLPASWCWCDMDWSPAVLQTCTIRRAWEEACGSDLRLPFRCPADYVFHIPSMERERLAYRMPGFLDSPQVPKAVRADRAELRMAAARPDPVQPAAAAAGVLWPNMTQSQLVAAAAHAQNASVLAISGMRPGLLRGFDRDDDSFDFDVLYANVARDLFWYSGSSREEGEWEEVLAYWHYDQPQPYTEGYAAWQPLTLEAPEWCDLVPGPRNREIVAWPNHPCQFLRNATAMGLAAALA
ncbi:hypothetical protein CHLNCDRAFT_141437 [Chlorella variabilis]|uniref:Nucleotide-diphospho-sugar transferase domain-containing protein n=1 Tax=Chlorella variabilis TaxID=554065 RepID=E1ZSV6_CHLVA|nr:hypothetical protein CHLNCDRAFT_141437 [Chlorella variabilis]EFN51102.1 hypothetical protein CHLNCDRAFT_141437 [Chlorella variabilis]|eukprot:XP_005843204.1 hypothetical protein CHLNCDRAFT_141437 [Chlorella variabilis]